MSQNKELTYEAAIARLEQIAQELSEGEPELEAGMKLFEESVKLSKFCYEKLDRCEADIKLLTEDGEREFKDE